MTRLALALSLALLTTACAVAPVAAPVAPGLIGVRPLTCGRVMLIVLVYDTDGAPENGGERMEVRIWQAADGRLSDLYAVVYWGAGQGASLERVELLHPTPRTLTAKRFLAQGGLCGLLTPPATT
jgi:hypothetical protein